MKALLPGLMLAETHLNSDYHVEIERVAAEVTVELVHGRHPCKQVVTLAELQSLHTERVLNVDPARVRRARARGIAALLPLDSRPRPGPAPAGGIRLDRHHIPCPANPRLGSQHLPQHGMTLSDARMRVEWR